MPLVVESRQDQRLLLGAGSVLGLLGASVMAAWFAGAGRLTAMSPGLEPMPLNTALAFLVAGVALAALATGRRRLAGGAAGLVGLYGVLTLVQHLTGHPRHLGTGFLLPDALVLEVPRWASPNAGLAFLLAGLCVATLAFVRTTPGRLTGALLGAGAGVIGLVDLAGYLAGRDGSVGTIILPQMAVLTAAGMLLLGLSACVVGARQAAAPTGAWRTRWPLVAGVVVAFSSVMLAQVLRWQERAQIRQTVEIAAQGIGYRVERNLTRRTVVMQALVRTWPEIREPGWETAAAASLSVIQGDNSLTWIGADGRPRLLAGPARMKSWRPRREHLDLAAASRAPLQLLDRDTGVPHLVLLVPTRSVANRAGFLLLVSDFVSGLGTDLRTVYPETGVLVRDEVGEVFSRARSAPGEEAFWGTEVTIASGALLWHVQVWPTAEALAASRSTLPIMTLSAGMLVAVLLGLALAFAGALRLRALEAEAAHAALTAQIREREVAEAALAQSELQLRQTSQLEAVGRLSGGIAHDYNNILTVIRGNIRSLLLQGAFTGLAAEALEQADRAAARGTLLTARLLAFSQRQLLQPEPVALGDLVAAQREQLAQLLGPSVRLVVERRPGADAAMVDRRWLGQVLLDLGFNALEAMPLGGALWLRTMPADERLRAEYGVQQPQGPAVMLEIEDSGRGMDEATRGRLFEPFFSTKKFGQGSGLALASAYGIVRQSGGDIAVLSVPGRGTRVGIFLPAATDTVTAVGPSDLRGRRILVVDDEPGVLRLLQRVLETAGCRVLAAASAEEALMELEGSEGGLDLLVTDIVMPGKSGVELADEVRARLPGTAVLFVSAYTSDALREQGIASLAAYLLQKPFTAEELLSQVRRTLAARSGQSPAR